MSSERNLLAGALARQMDLVTEEQLSEAVAAWAVQQERSLLGVLRERGALTEEHVAAVERRMPEPVLSTLTGAKRLPIPPLPAGPPPRYRRVRAHAKGGLGEVSVAVDEELRRDVALKEIRPQYADSAEMRERFVREAEITGQLEHPGVVPVYGLGAMSDGRPYYAMRFIGGESLDAAIRRGAERRWLLTRFVAVCNAVAFAHSRGVVHRDLKPANVMLGEFGETLVVDWGLARRVAEGPGRPLILSPALDATVDGQIVGTPAYMPPEQARGRVEDVGPHSDVWALGAMLYDILTGQPPYRPGPDAVVDAAACRPVPAGRWKPCVPAALAAVCHRAMAREPKDRYGGAKELAAEVERWLADEPVSAYRDPLSVRALRWARKRRTLVATLVVALVGGVVALGIGLAAVRAEQRRTAANLKLARKAVDECFNVAKSDPLFRGGGMLAAKKLLLAKALPFYREFQSPGGTEELDREEADQALAVGDITALLGKHDEALAAYARAEAVCQRLPDDRSRLANVLNSTGILLSELGRREEALTTYGRAEALRQKLADAHPDVSEYQRDLANSLIDTANLLAEVGRREEALKLYGRAEAVCQTLADAHRDVPGYRSSLANTLNSTGVLLSGLGRREEALTAYGRAEVIWRRLADGHPGVPDYPNRLGTTLNNTAVLLSQLGRPEEALTAHRRTETIQQKLADAHPGVPDFQNSLARAHNNTGVLLSGLGRREEALTAYGRAEVIWQQLADGHPGVPEYRNRLAGALNNTGLVLSGLDRHAEARSAHGRASVLLRVLLKSDPRDPQALAEVAKVHYNLACLWALAVGTTNARDRSGDLRQQEADKLTREALYHLAEVQRYGYFASPQKRDHFAKDTDFAAVRDRADFKAFVASLKPPGKP